MRSRLLALIVAGGLLGTALAGSANSAAAASKGTVNVLYAGSLTYLMEHRLGPAFSAATGYQFSGFAGGSDALAAQIKGKLRRGDVFISASPKVNATLEGKDNGDWVSWYSRFGSSPLLLGYNPKSRFAAALRSQPWYKVIARPGFLLGRTDPTLDPKGKLTVVTLDTAARRFHDAALKKIVAGNSNVFPEETLLGRLQSGQLDAGFFYSTEATQGHLRTVTLAPLHESATYTVTALNRDPDRAGAVAFIRFLLGSKGRSILTAAGIKLNRPVVDGEKAAVPSALRSVVG